MDTLILDTRCGSLHERDGFVEDALLAYVQLHCDNDAQLCVIQVKPDGDSELLLKPPYDLRDAVEKLNGHKRLINLQERAHAASGREQKQRSDSASLLGPANAVELCLDYIEASGTSYLQNVVLASGSLLHDDMKSVAHTREFNLAVDGLVRKHSLRIVHFFDASALTDADPGIEQKDSEPQAKLDAFNRAVPAVKDAVQELHALHRLTLWKLLNLADSSELRRCFLKFAAVATPSGQQRQEPPLCIETDMLRSLRAVPVMRKTVICACHGQTVTETLQKLALTCPATRKRLGKDNCISGAKIGHAQVYFPRDIQFKRGLEVDSAVELRVLQRLKATSVNVALLYGDPFLLSACSYLQHSLDKLATLSATWTTLLTSLQESEEVLLVQAPSELNGQCECAQRARAEDPPRIMPNTMLCVLMPDISDPAIAVIKPIATREMVRSMSSIIHALDYSQVDTGRIQHNVDDALHGLGSATDFNPLEYKTLFDQHVGVFLTVGQPLASFPVRAPEHATGTSAAKKKKKNALSLSVN